MKARLKAEETTGGSAAERQSRAARSRTASCSGMSRSSRRAMESASTSVAVVQPASSCAIKEMINFLSAYISYFWLRTAGGERAGGGVRVRVTAAAEVTQCRQHHGEQAPAGTVTP